MVCPKSFDVLHIEGANGAPETKKITYHSVSTEISGEARCWLTQNLGAERQALSIDDTTAASAGWYWQFNYRQGFKHNGQIRNQGMQNGKPGLTLIVGNLRMTLVCYYWGMVGGCQQVWNG